MANQKVTDLSALTASQLAIGDLNEIVDVSDTAMGAGGTNKKVTLEELARYFRDLRVLDRNTALNDIVNLATEQSLYSVSVPANTLGTNRGIRLLLVGDYLNTSGAARTIQLKVKFGATTLFDDVSATYAANASRREFRLMIDLFNQGATNDQILSGLWAMSGANSATSGRGTLDSTAFSAAIAGTQIHPLGGDAAEDSTAAKTLDVTVQHSTNNASLSIRRQLAIAEII